jgi:hypothetical protein
MRCGIATRCGTKRAGGRRGTEPKQAAYDDEEEERMLLLDDGGGDGGEAAACRCGAGIRSEKRARSGREAGEKRARSGRVRNGGRVGGRTPRTRRRMSPCPMTYRKQEDTREQATADL